MKSWKLSVLAVISCVAASYAVVASPVGPEPIQHNHALFGHNCSGSYSVKTYAGSQVVGMASGNSSNLSTIYVVGESSTAVKLRACAGTFVMSTYQYPGTPTYGLGQASCQTVSVSSGTASANYSVRVALMGLKARPIVGGGTQYVSTSNSAVDILATGPNGLVIHDRNTAGVPVDQVSLICK